MDEKVEKIQLLANVVESSDDAIITKTLDGNITTWNKGAELLYGYSAEEVIGKNISILAPPSLKSEINQLIKKIKDGKRVFHYDTIRIDKDAKQVDVSITMSPIFDNSGNLVGISTIARDITKQKKSEIALKESEEKFHEVFNNANDMIGLNLIKDDGLPGKFIEVNEIGIERLGYSRDEFLNMTPADIVAPEKRSEMPQNALKLSEKGHANFEIIHQTKDGKKIPVEINNHIFQLNGKKVALAISRDITERKQTEEVLENSERKYKKIFNNIQDVFFQTDTEGNITEISPSIERYSGYKPEELIGKPVETVYSNPEERNNFLKEFEEKGELVDYELKLKTKNEDLIDSSINAQLLLNLKNKPIGIEGTLRDITERKKAEKALKNSERMYRNIFENVQDIFYQTDLKGNIIEISPSIERYSGYKPEELINKTVETFYLNPEDRTYLIKEIEKKGEVADYEIILKAKDNNLLYVSTNAHLLFDSSKNPIGIEGSLRDITERKNIEIQLKNSLTEKEMLLKEIHHRVKNNLMIISSLLNLQSGYIKDKASQNIFKESQNRARSMALIHERLYQSTDLKRIDFGDYITSLATELFHTYVSDRNLIELKINVEDILLDINTSIPLGLIVNELITNSIKHGFPNGRKGKINIDFYLKNDHYEFAVKDNGIGFPEDINFQNTNSLGLQIVNSLTEQIDGEIELNKGNGTEFKITFKELDI
jgi:PAS domain S-box-containing protein